MAAPRSTTYSDIKNQNFESLGLAEQKLVFFTWYILSKPIFKNYTLDGK